MEGLRGVETLLVYVLGFGVFLAAVAVWVLAWRWMWKQRGIGFAEGWYEVADRRAAATSQAANKPPGAPLAGAVARPEGETPNTPKRPSPELAARAPAGPPRYLVPTEKE